MQRVLTRLDEKTKEFAGHPFFEYLRDTGVDPRRRLSFAPALAHFVMTFADLYRFVFRQEPAGDRVQEIVNAHTYEDGGHWQWFLADLRKLGQDPQMAYSDAIRYAWSEETQKQRLLSYRLCRLGFGASSTHKLVLVHCIEATGTVTLRCVSLVGSEIARLSGEKLVYFGAHHFETEANHTLEKDDARELIQGLSLEAELSRELVLLVDETFALFGATADEMLVFARSGKGIARTVDSP